MESRLQIPSTLKRFNLFDHFEKNLSRPHSKNDFFICIVIVAAYCLGTKIGFLFTVSSEPISMLWPPNAILMASLLLISTALWPFVLLLLFPAHLLIQLMDGVPLYLSLCWFFTNITEALIGAALVRRYTQSSVAFEKLRDTSLFLIFGVILAPFSTSFLDIGVVTVLGMGGDDFWRLWLNRWLANSVAILVVVPAIITAVQRKVFVTTATKSNKHIEAAALIICLATVMTVGLVIGNHSHVHHYATLFSLFPLMIWTVVRFGPGFVAQINLAVVMFAIWGALQWHGPFSVGSVLENVLAIQFFIVFAGSPMLLLSAVMEEWRMAEISANNRKQQLNMALQAGGMGIWSWDCEVDMVRWNGTSPMEKTTYPYAMVTTKASDQVHPDDRQKHEEAVSTAIALESSFESEARFIQANGEYRWFSVRGSVVKYKNGKPIEILGISTDIDRQKKEAVKIQRQRDELAHLGRVAMLGEISGTIAHELNQPLTAILSNAQAARRIYQEQFPEPTPISEILNDIISENKRAGEIIQRMRDLLKKGAVNPKPIDINAIIPKVIALENSDLIARNVVVKTHLHTALPPVVADSIQVQQVLLNLIINACDAMQHVDPSRRYIRIVTAWHDDTTLRVSVSDQGDGIAENKLESIFDAFVTSKALGLGLGLTLCRSIIEAHGGWLWAKNNREGGATFSFTLPVAIASDH